MDTCSRARPIARSIAFSSWPARPTKGSPERVPIPTNLVEIRENDRAAAARVQVEARERFQKWFAKGYAVTGLESRDGGTDYLLEPIAEIDGLRLPELTGD